LRYAPLTALCLASELRDEDALAGLNQAIREISTLYFVNHGSIREHFNALFLIQISAGRIDDAVRSAAHLVLLGDSGWSMSDGPPISPASGALAAFLKTRRADLEANWATVSSRLANSD
jgi:hypothetical protein